MEQPDDYVPMVDRYFSRKYVLDAGQKAGEDHCVLVHSNRICVITLADSHPILRNKKTVSRVNYKVSDKTDRLENNVSGKFKRGGQKLNETSPLCLIECTDGSMHKIYGCVRASLVEVNERLVSNPQLLTDKPTTAGYIAIVLTTLEHHQREMGRLLDAESYATAIVQRTEKQAAADSQSSSSSS